jgi:hypothetical protein
MICAIRNGVYVRSHLASLLALVATDDFIRVDGELLVGIDSDQKEARVGL